MAKKNLSKVEVQTQPIGKRIAMADPNIKVKEPKTTTTTTTVEQKATTTEQKPTNTTQTNSIDFIGLLKKYWWVLLIGFVLIRKML